MTVIHNITAIIILGTVSLATVSFSAPPEDQQFDSVEERRIQASILQERQDIRKEREEIALRKKELKSLEESADKKIAEMDRKLEELRTMQKKIEELLAKKSAEELKRTKELAGIYAKMTPVKAAQALSGVEEKLATQLLANMKTKSAARILDELNKQKTAVLSTTFATIQLE